MFLHAYRLANEKETREGLSGPFFKGYANAVASIHGRDLRTTLLPLLGRWKIGLFTQDGDSPAAVARFFLERGLASSYVAFVGENLGAADEHVTRWRYLAELVAMRFAPLNFLVLRRLHLSRLTPPLAMDDDTYCWVATLPDPTPSQEEEMRRWRSLVPGAGRRGLRQRGQRMHHT